MRKLGIALLALAVVFGLSTGVMADSLAEEVDFTIEVDEYATLDVPEDSVNLTIEDLEDNPDESLGTIEVAANTAVTTEVEMDITDYGELDKEDFWGYENSDDWIISPNIHADYDESHAGGYTDLVEGFELDEVSLDSNGEASQEYFFETNINEEADWYEFDADETVKGDLTFTVSAD